VYETVPVGLRDQPTFLNAAVLVETELPAAAFKEQVIGALEAQLKRRRSHDKNAPRTIDADIVLCNDEVLAYDGGDGRLRHIPEPDLLKFAHVAVPVADLLPTMPHPETAEPLATIAARLLAAATAVHAPGGTPPLWPRPDIRLDTA
jgi:2-amino-4-hydroxy-6-hydroxymethyldihydropteridine diphosphokinase